MFVWQSENSRIKILVQKPAETRLERKNHWKIEVLERKSRKGRFIALQLARSGFESPSCSAKNLWRHWRSKISWERDEKSLQINLLLFRESFFVESRSKVSVSIKMMKPKVDSNDSKILKSLRDIVSSGSNRQCFDCGQKGVTYVNMTCGSFVCTTCSGILWVANQPAFDQL